MLRSKRSPAMPMSHSGLRRAGVAVALMLAGLASLQSGPAEAQDTAPRRACYSFASVGITPG